MTEGVLVGTTVGFLLGARVGVSVGFSVEPQFEAYGFTSFNNDSLLVHVHVLQAATSTVAHDARRFSEQIYEPSSKISQYI